PNPATLAMTSMLVDYSKGDVTGFNTNLARYQNWLSQHEPEGFDETKVGYESFFNAFNPFYGALVLYVVAFVLVAFGWLFAAFDRPTWTLSANRSAFWLLVFALCVHTFALGSRIFISGRPPVTNLYSSAIFIGWAGVALGLILELVFRMGVGNVIASIAG